MRPMKVESGVVSRQEIKDATSPLSGNLQVAKEEEQQGKPVGEGERLSGSESSVEVETNHVDRDHSIDEMILDSRPINLFKETFDHSCLKYVPPGAAWGSLVLPIREHEGCLICATTKSMLDDALRVITEHVKMPVKLTLVESHLLEMFIAERYGYEGIDD